MNNNMTKTKKLFRNKSVDKKQLKQIMTSSFQDFGLMKASYLATKLKDIGFQYATQAGLSLSIEDLRVPPIKSNLLRSANENVSMAELEVKRGEITEVERFQKVINTWNTTSETLKDRVVQYFKETDPLNSIYIMAFSGARGNLSQVRQLVGMRGLMADFNGQIIDLPIVTNFREGLTVTDYIISSYGARKGLVDTALRTADSGYLTRRLVDVAQSIIVRQKDCKTQNGIQLTEVRHGNNLVVSLEERILGRRLAFPMTFLLKTSSLDKYKEEEVDSTLAKAIVNEKISSVIVRSPLTCLSRRSVCQYCYGWNLAYGNLINLGEAVGIIAAQSIGEPGTQLTMRTFHTGGVFTTEASRQIRAPFSGKLVYSTNLKTQKTRTQYGKTVCTSQNKASLGLITYKNKKIDLEILPETLILAKNNSVIKKNQILFELSSKTKKTRSGRASKNVFANFSGQVVFEDKKTKKIKRLSKSIISDSSNYLLWILSGQVSSIPLNSPLQVQPGVSLRRKQVLAESKLTTLFEGRLKLLSEKKDLKLLSNSSSLRGLNIVFEKTLKGFIKPVIYGSQNRKLIFNNLRFDSAKAPIIGYLINLNYKTRTGGVLYSANFSAQKKTLSSKLKLKTAEFKSCKTLFYMPEATYNLEKTEKESVQLLVKTGDLIQGQTELFENTFSTISGLVEVKTHKKLAKTIVIKPVKVYVLKKTKRFKNFQQKLVYPGEILLNSIEVEHLSFLDAKTIGGQTYIRLFPIVRYELTNRQDELSSFFNHKDTGLKDINLETGRFKFERKIEGNEPIQLLRRALYFQPQSIASIYEMQLSFSLKVEKRKQLKLNLLLLEKIIFDEHLPKELKKEEVNTVTFVEKNQYMEPSSIVTSFQVLNTEKNQIQSIKEQLLKKERKLLLLTNKDSNKIYLEEANHFLRENTFVHFQETTKTNLFFKNSGLITKVSGNTVFLQLGQPYLFLQGGTILKDQDDLLIKGENLGKLVYELAKTGDIVQGLPLVEKILEARKPSSEAQLARRPGIVTNIFSEAQVAINQGILPKMSLSTQKRKFQILVIAPSLKEEYLSDASQRLLISKFEYINVGQPLTDATINPHSLLIIYFEYYKSLKFLTPYQSAYRSLRKLQAFLLNSIQAVYYSQGVCIADKHVEIIVKEMTRKVQITDSGDSHLLKEEFLDLHQVFSINKSLKNKEHAQFSPVLFGITKAALKTSSFISAASFQSTIRVLTEAAIQGKTDWLRGLKENVIVGRLIPAGTGFTVYNDLSHLKVKIPSGNALPPGSEPKASLNFSSQKKYKTLKNRLKFTIL